MVAAAEPVVVEAAGVTAGSTRGGLSPAFCSWLRRCNTLIVLDDTTVMSGEPRPIHPDVPLYKSRTIYSGSHILYGLKLKAVEQQYLRLGG